MDAPGRKVRPQAVLFACNFNTVRSVMAVGLMQRRFGRAIWVDSCGARGGAAPDPFVAAVMDEAGVDVTKHRPKTFDQLDELLVALGAGVGRS